jgi:hypothetical protein
MNKTVDDVIEDIRKIYYDESVDKRTTLSRMEEILEEVSDLVSFIRGSL